MCLLAVAGCSNQTSLPPIHVGHVATLSGVGKEKGEQAARGIRLAVEEQAKQAAQKGERPIVVHHTDTRGSLDGFEAEAVRLVTVSKAVALLGGTTAEEAVRLDRAQVALITPLGMRPAGISSLVFSTGLSPQFQGRVLARFALEVLRPARLTVFVDSQREDAVALSDAFLQVFTKDKTGSAISTWRYTKESPISESLKRVKEEKIDAVLLAGSIRAASEFRKEMGNKVSILYSGDDEHVRSFLDYNLLDKVYLASAFARDADAERTREFVNAYRKAYSEDPDVYAAVAYDNARLLFEALRQSRPDPSETLTAISEKITKALSQLKDFPGLTGPLAFGPDQQLRRPAFVVGIERGMGKLLKRYPAEE